MEKFFMWYYGTRLGKALRYENYDKAAKIMDKCIRHRARYTKRSYADTQNGMLACYENDDDIEFRNMAMIYRQKYCK